LSERWEGNNYDKVSLPQLQEHLEKLPLFAMLLNNPYFQTAQMFIGSSSHKQC
jgi:hypothetical protein